MILVIYCCFHRFCGFDWLKAAVWLIWLKEVSASFKPFCPFMSNSFLFFVCWEVFHQQWDGHTRGPAQKTSGVITYSETVQTSEWNWNWVKKQVKPEPKLGVATICSKWHTSSTLARICSPHLTVNWIIFGVLDCWSDKTQHQKTSAWTFIEQIN